MASIFVPMDAVDTTLLEFITGLNNGVMIPHHSHPAGPQWELAAYRKFRIAMEDLELQLAREVLPDEWALFTEGEVRGERTVSDREVLIRDI